MTKQDVLKQYFGYDTFRGGQEEIIDALLAGRDVLAVMPTGAGKSVCYQVPALLLPGITLVVSPLVSLMRDQVTQLVQMGVPAAYLNSSLTYRQYLLALDRAREGRYKIIYVAPERLDTEGFQSFVRSAQISMVAVDEAHCISQWGQDFRPAYLNIPDFVDRLPQRPVVGAFTATATSEVREDIQRLLELEAPLSITTGFDRDNLYLEVCHPSVKRVELLARVRAALRVNRYGGGSLPGGVFSAQGLTINYERRKVFVDGQEVRLTQTEYNIVAFLSEHAGRVMTYAAIVKAIWGDTDIGSTKKLQVNMANIRKKLGSRPGSNAYILNELGVGYRMIDEDARSGEINE